MARTRQRPGRTPVLLSAILLVCVGALLVETRTNALRRLFDIEGHTCTGETEPRADILIWYAAHKNRVAIEGIIGGETFFGIPYRLLNY